MESSPEKNPATLHFRIGNVRRPETPERLRDLSRRCREAVVRAHQRGDLPSFYGPGVGFRFAPDEIYVHAVRVGADGADPADLTRAEMQGRADAWTMFEAWQREVAEFADSYFISSGPSIGVRETRASWGR